MRPTGGPGRGGGRGQTVSPLVDPWVPTELIEQGEWGGVFIKRHPTVHGKLCLENSINYGEKSRKVARSSTKHKKSLGVSRKGRGDLKVFID